MLSITVAFTWKGAAVASAVMAFPLLLRAVRLSPEGSDPGLEHAARTLGSGTWRVFPTVTLPLIIPGVITGLILAFSRSLGEFGATITFVSIIKGETQTLPLALYTLTQVPNGEVAAMRLRVIAVAIAMAALVASEFLARRFAGHMRGLISCSMYVSKKVRAVSRSMPPSIPGKELRPCSEVRGPARLPSSTWWPGLCAPIRDISPSKAAPSSCRERDQSPAGKTAHRLHFPGRTSVPPFFRAHQSHLWNAPDPGKDALRDLGPGSGSAGNRAFAQAETGQTVGRGKAARGDSLDESVQMGPLINRGRLEAMEAFVADAREKGARVLSGGQRIGKRGYFFPLTYLPMYLKTLKPCNQSLLDPSRLSIL